MVAGDSPGLLGPAHRGRVAHDHTNHTIRPIPNCPTLAAEVQHHPFPAGILRPPNYLPRIRQESFTTVKILLVDDSKLDRMRVSECLEESGFEYVVAENGTKAWRTG